MKHNLIDGNTEVLLHSTKNMTQFTIRVGLHPKDSERIMKMICIELKNRCRKSKAQIKELNAELENTKK